MKKNISILFMVALVIKLLAALLIPLTLDEYYYLVWGQELQLSYFDHPPMTGWLMYFGDLFKSISDGAIRWPFIILTHATLYVWYLLLKPHFETKKMFCFLLVALLNPLWGCGVFIATPDIPLLFFWSTSIYFTYKLLRTPSAMNYSLLGASLGLGFLSKYQIVLFIPCLILFIINNKAYKNLLNYRVIFSLLFGFLFCLPVLIWNYQHEWASFDFQWNHGMTSLDWKWFWPIEYFLGQFLIIFPTFAILAFKNKQSNSALPSLSSFVIFPLLFFLYTSFKSHVEANWAIMAYPSLYALAFINFGNQSYKWVNRTLVFWSITILAVFSLTLFSNHQQVKKLRLFESSKFENVLTFSHTETPIVAFSYQLTSYLRFKLNKSICKFPKYGRQDFYNYLETCKQLPNHFFYVLPTGYAPPVEKDFPDYKVTNKITIDNKYFALEVKKK